LEGNFKAGFLISSNTFASGGAEPLPFAANMGDLIKLVRTYRMTPGLAERLQLGEEIFRQVEPPLRFFLLNAVSRPASDDVLQEVLKGIVVGLPKFAGNSNGEFWAWCYGIARNKINDQLRRQMNERTQPMPPEELWRLVEVSAQSSPLSAADRHDLEYAMTLLRRSKPECYDYLWKHFVFGHDYAEIAAEENLKYDNVRMRIGRCLDEVQTLMA
jgi:RNA polymerase sigma factor (sigma-70 family)